MYSELNKSIRDCTLAQKGTIEDDQKAIVIYNVEMSQWPHFNCCIRYDEKIICNYNIFHEPYYSWNATTK